jgi:hypothetical protein
MDKISSRRVRKTVDMVVEITNHEKGGSRLNNSVEQLRKLVKKGRGGLTRRSIDDDKTNRSGPKREEKIKMLERRIARIRKTATHERVKTQESKIATSCAGPGSVKISITIRTRLHQN